MDPVVGHGDRFTWDEALMVALPIAVFAAVLVTANRRATTLAARRDAELGQGPDPTGGSDDGPGAAGTRPGR
jgi:hypothetical protein